MCKTAAPMLEAVRVGAGLEPCAFWGSWYTLGQTHETSHVDGIGEQAKFCIYLKASLVDFHLNSSLLVMMRTAGPSGESRLTEMTAAPAVPSESATAVRPMEPLEAAECSSHL